MPRSGHEQHLWRPFWIILFVALSSAVVAATVAVLDRPSAVSSPTPSQHLPTSASSSAPPAMDRQPDKCATELVLKMSLEERVGQLLMVGTPVDSPREAFGRIQHYHLGGVFLAGRSQRSAAFHRKAIEDLQKTATSSTGVPLHIGIDQEGGQVQTFQGADFPPVPAAVEQGMWDTATLSERTTDWAGRLARVGVTIDLAPVADTVPAGTAADNPPIGALDRQYGADPDAVARSIATVVSAAQAAGVATTLKHFPGLGRTRENTDTSAAVDEQTTVDDRHLKPFASGIAAGSAAVMVSSARYPQLDQENIAAFSTQVVTGLLRQELGFSGVVMSDDLGAAAAVQSVPPGLRAVRFIRAGGDLVLTVRPDDAAPMAIALAVAARESAAFSARVTNAAVHVVASKHRMRLFQCLTPN